jgi:hypothetical protein
MLPPGADERIAGPRRWLVETILTEFFALRSYACVGVPLLTENSAPVRLAHFIRDACPRQPHELGEWRVRPARAAGQRGYEPGHGRVPVTVERPQVKGLVLTMRPTLTSAVRRARRQTSRPRKRSPLAAISSKLKSPSQELCQCLHLIEQPIEGSCSLGPWPVSATSFIASNRSRRAFGTGVMREASSRPRYCNSSCALKPKKSGVH